MKDVLRLATRLGAWATERADMPVDSMVGQQGELEEWRAGVPSRTPREEVSQATGGEMRVWGPA